MVWGNPRPMGADQRPCSFRFRKGNPMFMWEAWEEKTAWKRNTRYGVVFESVSRGDAFQEVLHRWQVSVARFQASNASKSEPHES